MPLLVVLGLISFSSAIAIRIPDPLSPLIARDLGVTVETAALLASAYAFPYALAQPVLGPLADALGKARVIKVCLAVVAAATLAGWLAPDYGTLAASRVVAGAASGGAIPICFAIVGDRFDYAHRQVALARVLAAAVTGQLFGSVASGAIGDAFGWRAPFLVSLTISAAALAATILALRPRADATRKPFTLAGARAGYAQVLANPRAPICYATVFCGGLANYGVFPHLAHLFEMRGVGGVREAGFAVGGFGVGGILFSFAVGAILKRIGMFAMMRLGGVIAGSALATLALTQAWQAAAGAFVAIGVGFYMVHNSMQTQASELAPSARGSAMALHACFFFLGIALGPPVTGLGFATIGPTPTLLALAAFASVIGATSAALLTARGARG
ncbi:MAG: MFS transporter [Methylobacteriaceae bacterium]|nr:MFS transporter [Methylobacteriaceae bacterium]